MEEMAELNEQSIKMRTFKEFEEQFGNGAYSTFFRMFQDKVYSTGGDFDISDLFKMFLDYQGIPVETPESETETEDYNTIRCRNCECSYSAVSGSIEKEAGGESSQKDQVEKDEEAEKKETALHAITSKGEVLKFKQEPILKAKPKDWCPF